MIANSDLEILLDLLNNYQNKFINGIQDQDLIAFQQEHQSLLHNLQQKYGDKTNQVIEKSELAGDGWLQPETDLLAKIKEQEKQLKIILEAEKQKVIQGLNQIQSNNRAQRGYLKPGENEARFIDKYK